MDLIQCIFGLIRKVWVIVLILVCSWSCEPEPINVPPLAVLDVFPYAGDTTTIFTFDATQSSDAEDVKEKLSVRWDWNDDGIWDTGFEPALKTAYRFMSRGMKYIRMELSDSDGSTVVLTDSVRIFPIPVFGSMTDPRDGQVYKTVYLEDNWWMAESLRYGTIIPSDSNQQDNQIIEAYVYNNELKNIGKYGALYSWFEAMQYNDTEMSQGVCPDGWHVPSHMEWVRIAPRDVPYLFLTYYYGPDGPGGLNLLYGGYFEFIQESPQRIEREKTFMLEDISVGFWTSTHQIYQYEDYTDHEAVQRQNFFISIYSPMSGTTGFNYDHTGLILLRDHIHLWGEPVTYERYVNHPKNARYAHYVRCTKNQ